MKSLGRKHARLRLCGFGTPVEAALCRDVAVKCLGIKARGLNADESVYAPLNQF